MIKADMAASRGIVWIASYPKSGNTWVRVFLHHLARIVAGLPEDGDELANLRQSSLYELFLVPHYEKATGKPKADFTLTDINRARPRVHAMIAEERTSAALVKTHTVRTTINGDPTINPDVFLGAVYLMRDPLDIAVSLQDFYAIKQDSAVGALNARDFTSNPHGVFELWGSWSQNVASWTTVAEAETLVMRYEDLMVDPVDSFTEITRHMRIEASAGQIAEAIALASFKRMRAKESAGGFEEKPVASQKLFREGRIGQGREDLTADQKRRIVKAHHAEMARHGYLTEDLLEFVPQPQS